MNEDFYNLAFERSVLASIIFEPTLFTRLQLVEDDFYLQAHKHIFHAMIALHDEDQPIDEEFIRIWLSNRKKFDEKAMIEVLTSNPISGVMQYVYELKDRAQRRALWQLGINLQKQEFIKASDGVDLIQSAIKSITDMRVGTGIEMVSLLDVEDRDTDFILKRWLPFPKGVVSMIGAPGGTGKSWSVLQVANRFIDENPYSKACVWLSEDQPSTSKGRHKAISTDVMSSLHSNYRNVHIPKERPKHLIVDGKFDHHAFYRMRQSLKGYDLVILDPLRAFFGGDENSNSDANMFMAPFQDWAAEDDIVIIFVHHSRKNDDEGFKSNIRGASAFVDACRLVYEMSKIYKNHRTGELDMDRAHERMFTMTKDNLGAMQQLGDFKATRHITPRKTAKALVVEEYQYKAEMPII